MKEKVGDIDEPTSGHLSVIGLAWLIPICLLWDKLPKSESSSNEVQTSHNENGKSAAIVVMSVFLLESMLHRTFLMMKELERMKSYKGDGSNLKEFFQIEFGNKYCDEIQELFDVRNALTHNHIWRSTIKWTSTGLEYVENPEMLGYSNKEFNRRYDTKNPLCQYK